MANTIVVVDACCKVNNANKKGRSSKGQAACGCVIIDEKGEIHEYSQFLGEMTVPQAEFEGLVFALDKAAAHTRKKVEVRMDSELVIKWMNKEYRLKKDHIKPIYDRALTNANRFDDVVYNHHSRSCNLAKQADKIANKKIKEYVN